MNKITRSALALLLCAAMLTATACKSTPPVTDGDGDKPTSEETSVNEVESARFDEFLDALFKSEISLDTISLHWMVKDPSVYGLSDMEPKWYTDDADDAYPLQTIVDVLSTFKKSDLTEDQRLTYDILTDYCDLQIKMGAASAAYASSQLDTGTGFQSNIPTALAEYEFYSEKDITDYIALIKLLPDYVQTVIDYESERVDLGYGSPDKVLDEVINQISQISDAGDDFYLYSVTEDKIMALDFLNDEQKSTYISEIKTAISENMIPAFQSLKSAVEGFYSKAVNNGGMAGFDGGAEYYTYLAQYATSTDYSCEELIKMLDDDYTSLYNKLYSVASENYDAYYSYFMDGYTSPTDPSEILSYLRANINKDFPEISGDVYNVDYLPEEMEEVMSGVVAYYVTPQVDNYLSGKIKINGGTIDEGSLYSTLAHEGYPGHMYQNIYFYSTDAHDIRKLISFGGYSEGWAVYAETYSYSIFEYDKFASVYATLDRINACMSWNVSCRVDLGVNYEGWTVADLENYLDSAGFDSSFAEELYYFVVGSPATYLQYYIGYLEIMDIRSEAQSELGRDFSLLEFNKAVLDVGPCQFKYVRQAVQAYVDSKK